MNRHITGLSAGAVSAVLIMTALFVETPATVRAQRGSSVVPRAALEGQQLSREADALVKQGQEMEAVRLYLAAHVKYQNTILDFFEQTLRAGMGGRPVDEEALMRAGGVVAELRNVNLSKLWIVLDPDDRAFEKGLEAERADLLRRFDQFAGPSSAGPLETFLHALYPEDHSGDRQMAALRDGRLPPSKRWDRLKRLDSAP